LSRMLVIAGPARQSRLAAIFLPLLA